VDTKGPLSSRHAWNCWKWHSDCVEFFTLHFLLQRLFPSASASMARNITLSDAARKLRMSKLTPADIKINSELSELKMRRSPYVVMYFRRGRLVVENYITRRSFQIDLAGLMLLRYFSTWRTVSQTSRALGAYTRETTILSIQNLKGCGLLNTKGSDKDKIETRFCKK